MNDNNDFDKFRFDADGKTVTVYKSAAVDSPLSI